MSDLKHNAKFNKLLQGKVIDSARYATTEECEEQGWYNRPLVIFFTDGTAILPMRDDEGNDGGAMHFSSPYEDEQQTIYVLR